MTAPVANRRCETRLALNFFNVHSNILPNPAKTQKPYGRFFGAIFLGGVESVEHPQLQPLAGRKIPKNRKNTKKSVFFLERPPPVFLPDGPQKSLFLLSVRFLERGQGRL
jgi:hypothetical protein